GLAGVDQCGAVIHSGHAVLSGADTAQTVLPSRRRSAPTAYPGDTLRAGPGPGRTPPGCRAGPPGFARRLASRCSVLAARPCAAAGPPPAVAQTPAPRPP